MSECACCRACYCDCKEAALIAALEQAVKEGCNWCALDSRGDYDGTHSDAICSMPRTRAKLETLRKEKP